MYILANVFDASQLPAAGPMRRVAILLTLALSTTQAAPPVITASVIAGGGGTSKSPGGCFKLDATVGQATTGVSSGGSFTLNSGFLPGNGDHDSIFNHSFEVCS